MKTVRTVPERQKVWVLENKAGKAIRVGLETVKRDDVYAVGFATRKDLMTALGIDGPKDLGPGEKIKRVELKL